MKKSTPSHNSAEAGATFIEIVTGILIVAMLIAITVMGVMAFRESNKIDRSLSAIFQLKETIKLHKGLAALTVILSITRSGPPI